MYMYTVPLVNAGETVPPMDEVFAAKLDEERVTHDVVFVDGTRPRFDVSLAAPQELCWVAKYTSLAAVTGLTETVQAPLETVVVPTSVIVLLTRL
jgi:hypothetical protein